MTGKLATRLRDGTDGAKTHDQQAADHRALVAERVSDVAPG